MGNGLPPGPAGDDVAIDEGTLPRAGTPSPGPIGLDSSGGSARGTPASIVESILSYARRQRGRRVGDGECFAFADTALRGAGAKSAADYGDVSPNADYVWGQSVALSGVAPGDVVQFRDYRYDLARETEEAEGTRTWNEFKERPHHTAVVDRVDADGVITVLEQNAPPGSAVVRTVLYFRTVTITSGRTTTRITVQGTVRFYRPQAR
jgi:hypothetical protein